MSAPPVSVSVPAQTHRLSSVPYMLFPSAISCLPALFTMPDSCVCCSEKCGGTGTFMSMCSNGKYSLEGRAPPRDIKPWCFERMSWYSDDSTTYQDLSDIWQLLSRKRAVSVRSGQRIVHHLDRVLTFLAKLSSVSRSIHPSACCPTTLEPGE